MFSGAEQLVESFFIEISAQLRVRPGLGSVGASLEDYGEAFSGLGWLPLVGPWIERGRGATKLLGKLLQRRREGTSDKRQKVKLALDSLDRPIIVVLDDIDRLSTAEIRDVFKLVRLTASFPNVIYILAFDRSRVESALGEEGIPGRDYLEKILQIAVDLPAVPPNLLIKQVLAALDSALSGLAVRDIDENVWPDIFMEIVNPLVRTMRDVRRYSASAHGTVRELGERIALADLLAVEAVRIFLPDVFRELSSAVEALTTASGLGYGARDDDPEHKARIDTLVTAAGHNHNVVESLVRRIFPAAQHHLGGSHYGPDWNKTWLRDRRLANQEMLRLYLERIEGDRLEAFGNAEKAWAIMSDREALESHLQSIDRNHLQDVIAALETYEDQFRHEHVVPGCIALLNLLPELPERQRGLFDLDTRTIVGRVVYRLLRSIQDQDATASAVAEVLPELSTLSAKWELITDVGYREGAGHKLVSEQVADDLERAWIAEVRAASVKTLLNEYDLLRVLFFASRGSTEADEDGGLAVPDDPRLTLAVLRTGRSDTRSQTAGNRSVRLLPRLAWGTMVDVYGSESVLEERIQALIATNPQGEDELLDIARRYLDGWRPNDFADVDDDE